MRRVRRDRAYRALLACALAFAWQGSAQAETVTIEAGADCNTAAHADPHDSKLGLAAGTLLLKPSGDCKFVTDTTAHKFWDVLDGKATTFPANKVSIGAYEIKVTYDFADGKAHCIRFDVVATATGNARDWACYTPPSPPPSPAP